MEKVSADPTSRFLWEQIHSEPDWRAESSPDGFSGSLFPFSAVICSLDNSETDSDPFEEKENELSRNVRRD